MLLTIEGASYFFTPIRLFRMEHGLPDEFGVALFEPKDYTGLGRIDRARAELNGLREAVLDAIPSALPALEWLNVTRDLTHLFRQQLYAINHRVGLKDVEVEFAVAGFSDVCQAMAYALLRAGNQTDFQTIYGEWLDNSVRVFSEVHTYPHRGGTWRVRIVAHAYGRVGLMIEAGDSRYAVQDSTLACPAEGFMMTLLGEVADRMIAATRR